VADELEELQDELVLGRTNPEDLSRIFRLKHLLGSMRKVLCPQRDVMGVLMRHTGPHLTERTAHYLRDAYDHLVRISESIDTGRELLADAVDLHHTILSNRTNEIMKRLTILSAVFMPLTFVTGFFGQNFEHLPFKSDELMYAMLGACVLLPVSMLYWFKRSRWI
jgi:magnesium transporter